MGPEGDCNTNCGECACENTQRIDKGTGRHEKIRRPVKTLQTSAQSR